MRRVLFAILLSLFMAGSVEAAGVQDTQLADDMWIDSVEEYEQGATIVTETYAENTLIPYDSHDGYAIVAPWGQHFDKYVYPSNSDKTWRSLDLVFDVYNGTNYSWSDYHFEFWNLSFTERVSVDIIAPVNNIFDQISGDAQILTFWSDTERQDPGEWSMFHMIIDLDNTIENGFSIRQVATTVPIPGAVWLIGSGFIGLVGIRRKFRQ